MSVFTGNLNAWKELIEVDYYTYFVKTWITFNSWYKINYPGLKSDREHINQIKNKSNPFRDNLINLLIRNNELKEHVGNLHFELENKMISKDGDYISLEKIYVKNNDIPNPYNETYRNIKYFMQQQDQSYKILVKDIKKNKVLLNTELNSIERNQLSRLRDYVKLTESRKKIVDLMVEEFQPLKKISLLERGGTGVKLGSYYFKDDYELIAAGLIEVIYSLRNALFHGELIPNKDYIKAYEYAYNILKASHIKNNNLNFIFI